MKIKIPFVSFETDTMCPCDEYKDYEIKIKCVKTKLHSRYIACIAAGIVIWLLATGEANTAEFSAWISFASTIASIILSVVAIILSITGESKTDAIKNDLAETARKLDGIADKMNKEMAGTNNDIRELIKQLGVQIEILQEKVDKVPEKVDKYTKTNKK